MTKTFNSVLGRVENIVVKGENAGYQHLLLFPQRFQKLSILGLLKVWTVWERVKKTVSLMANMITKIILALDNPSPCLQTILKNVFGFFLHNNFNLFSKDLHCRHVENRACFTQQKNMDSQKFKVFCDSNSYLTQRMIAMFETFEQSRKHSEKSKKCL